MKENKLENNLFFVCSLIEYIARKTKNEKKYIIDKIDINYIKKIYDFADVYHTENIDKISDEIISKFNIKTGNYDIISNCRYSLPTYWDIGEVYKRLIVMLCKNSKDYITKLVEVLTSWIIKDLDNYNSSLYYENPGYILECYKEGKII